jgi:hypothetical protein
MWAFYVNRGQAIASFGIESKDAPLMEFQPANRAYQATPLMGFRTFLKLSGGVELQTYEPFAPHNEIQGASQQMATGANELEIVETNPRLGLKTSVLYYSLPNEPFAGLVRRVTIQNLGQAALTFELLDGMPALIPYGVNNFFLKELGRTVESWMEVFNRAANVPFYRLRASVVDKVEVETFQAGHFALAIAGETLLSVLVDPATVFESDTSFAHPLGFYSQPLADLLQQPQVTCGRTPCAFFAHQATLAPQESLTLYSLYGHSAGLEVLQRHLSRLTHPAYFEEKAQQAAALATGLTDTVATHTADPLFDAYCRQNFLDNVLRGGWPALLGDPAKPHVYPIYSRKHGDIERDYNAFLIAPEPYSQGEVSYRDVNQNRRDTVRLEPAVADFDLYTFISLIQTDGYNPRTLQGFNFRLAPEKQAALLAGVEQPGALRALLSGAFTPGKLLREIGEQNIPLPVPPAVFMEQVLSQAKQHLEATFGEGYWIDHWEYNLDLVESYLAIYPDRQAERLFERADLPFYDSALIVQPRSRKYVLSGGEPRQIGSLLEDKEKQALITSRGELPHWVRTQSGHGPIYRTTLAAKLILTALLKFTTLDPWGMGIEMEAGRPGWYDALNGLPALFGSGMAETFELQRWLAFLRGALQAQGNGEIHLPVEAVDLLAEVQRQLAGYQQDCGPERDFHYWDAVSSARETYRARTRLGVDGAERSIPLVELDAALALCQDKLAGGVARALELSGGLPPTYFTFQLEEYERLAENDPQGRPYLRAKRFSPSVLPPFLEGPVRAFKTLSNPEAARQLYDQVRASPLFDRKLKMYKVNASLAGQPHTIGRARAFPPGWLENESIWLHMEYKYLLETLKAGLYDEFFIDLRQTLVPFFDVQVYGRSLLENSSFLASSAHPDPSLHGTGFVARLSGSTAEFLSIWNLMLAGAQPFFVQEDQLCLALRPALPGWLFSAEGEISFRFLGCCTVTYHNPRRRTLTPDILPRRVLLGEAGTSHELSGSVIGAPDAERVRGGLIERIDIFYL